VYFGSKFPTAIGGTVCVGEYLYGTTGAALVCLEFKTGTSKWEERAFAPASLVYADNRLYLHTESGEVGLVEASPEGFREKGRFTPPNRPKLAEGMERTWAYPALANGRLYLRDHDRLWSYQVSRTQ
jgi:hypothetical protein